MGRQGRLQGRLQTGDRPVPWPFLDVAGIHEVDAVRVVAVEVAGYLAAAVAEIIIRIKRSFTEIKGYGLKN